MSILINNYLFWADMTIPISWGYVLIIIFSLLFARINSKLSCLSYVLPAIYLAEKLVSYFEGKEGFFQIAFLQMMMLIGILHFTEGLLVFWFGHKRSEAVITYKGNEITGGYQAYGKWIVPLFLFSVGGFYVPIFAGIFYFNETFTRQVEEKSERTGLAIALYGICIFLLTQAVKREVLTLTGAMLIMPLLHEVLFLWDRMLERGADLYTYPERGIRLMCFASAANMPKPFDRGDIFLDANGTPLPNEAAYETALQAAVILLHIQKIGGEEIYVLIRNAQLRALDPIFLPRA